jgi:hypothetical protein
MFVIMTTIVIMHQLSSTIGEKEHLWPLRKVYKRCLELVGRCLMLPLTVSFFMTGIPSTDSMESKWGIVYSVWMISGVIAVREYYGFRAKYVRALVELEEKFHFLDDNLQKLSMPEFLVMKYILFDKLSLPAALSPPHDSSQNNNVWKDHEQEEHGAEREFVKHGAKPVEDNLSSASVDTVTKEDDIISGTTHGRYSIQKQEEHVRLTDDHGNQKEEEEDGDEQDEGLDHFYSFFHMDRPAKLIIGSYKERRNSFNDVYQNQPAHDQLPTTRLYPLKKNKTPSNQHRLNQPNEHDHHTNY